MRALLIYLIGAVMGLSYLCITNASPLNNFIIKELSEPLKVKDIANIRQEKWYQDLKAKKAYAVCFKVKDKQYFKPIANTKALPIYGCVFSSQQFMNGVLLRPGIFTHTPLGIVNTKQLHESPLMTTVGGHDFNDSDFSKYAKALPFPKSVNISDEKKALEAAERIFWKKIIAPKLPSGKFHFFAIIDRWSFVENLSHELIHGQFYQYETIIKPKVKSIWSHMDKADQALILDTFKKAGYDTTQQDLMLREIMSYFLQSNALEFISVVQALRPMAGIVPKYRSLLKQTIESQGIQVVDLPAPFQPPPNDMVS